LCHAKVGGEGTKTLTSRISKLFEGLFPSSIPGLLSLTSGGRKNKRTELDDRRLTLCYAKVGGQSISDSW